MDLAHVAWELYGLAPGEFRAARDQRAGEARAAGDGELAAAIARLRRPTVSAWLVNQLAREAGDDLSRLAELGEALREAQSSLVGDRLRELSGQRRDQVRALTQRAKRLAGQAGQPITAQVEREVAATLETALADPGAAAAVRAGQLTSALSHIGLGAPHQAPGARGSGPGTPERGRGGTGRGGTGRGGTGRGGTGRGGTGRGGTGRGGTGRGRHLALAAASVGEEEPRRQRTVRGSATPPRPAREVTAAGRAAREAEAAAQEAAREAAAAQRRAREVAAAERDVRESEEMAREAGAALDEADRRTAAARARRDSARRKLAELEEQLAAEQAEEGEAIRELRQAQRHREVAARSAGAAQRRVLQAKARLKKYL